MVQASKTIDKARDIGIDDDSAFIGYQEGLYDAYFKILISLGYTVKDIATMEQVVVEEIKGLDSRGKICETIN